MRDVFLADQAGLAARHAAVLRPSIPTRLMVTGGIAAAVALYIGGLVMLGVSPARILAGLSRLGDIVALMIPPIPGTWTRAEIYLHALGQTLAIAFLGTMGAAILAIPLGFLAARNITASRILRFLTRRTLDAGRSIDTLIWALIWINVVGLGPFAGVLAVMTSDIGALGRLFSEALEAADRKAVDGVTSTGGGPVSRVRFGIIPQVLPVMASQVLYFFESNTRSATIIGIVGAGGIGAHLSEQIRILEWQQVSFLVILILVTVAAIDWVSGKLRFAIMGRAPAGAAA
jgi:phosphonate transport system permease protein